MMIQVQVEKISFYPPSKGYAVLLKEAMGSRFLPVIVGSFEAQSIALALEEVQMPRPMTHDLFCNILDELDVEIGEVVISELAEGTFFSKISLESQLGTREIDARPTALPYGLLESLHPVARRNGGRGQRPHPSPVAPAPVRTRQADRHGAAAVAHWRRPGLSGLHRNLLQTNYYRSCAVVAWP